MAEEEKKLKLGKGVAFVKSRLKHLPQGDDIWEADFRALPKPMMQTEAHYLGMVVTQKGGSQLADLSVHGRTSVNDLAEVVRALALELSPLIAEKDLDFEIDTQPGAVRSHEWMLRELSRNLLHNAIRHSPPGGRLAVRVVADANAVALTIADTGPGVTAALQARLFQPFSAGDARGGSGLGLAICQEIAHALGGTITLENRESHGHVLGLDATVRLPLAEPGH